MLQFNWRSVVKVHTIFSLTRIKVKIDLSCIWNTYDFMRGSRKFCQGRSKFDNIFILFYFKLMRGETIQNTTISGPLSARQRNVPMTTVIFRLSEQILLRSPIFFVIFRGGGSGSPVPPSGSAHGFLLLLIIMIKKIRSM